MTTSTLKSHVEDVIDEVSKVMRTSSRSVDEELEGLGEIFLKRLVFQCFNESSLTIK